MLPTRANAFRLSRQPAMKNVPVPTRKREKPRTASYARYAAYNPRVSMSERASNARYGAVFAIRALRAQTARSENAFRVMMSI